jgi:hypothetical protein
MPKTIKMSKTTIAKLADFYSGVTLFLFWLIIIFIVVAIIILFVADSAEGRSLALIMLGVGVLAIVAIGGVAVALDIMNTNRELASQQQKNIALLEQHTKILNSLNGYLSSYEPNAKGSSEEPDVETSTQKSATAPSQKERDNNKEFKKTEFSEPAPPNIETSETVEHRGQSIEKKANFWLVGEHRFFSLRLAKDFIDGK